MSGSADCGNLWREQRTEISGLTLRVSLCCYVSSILPFVFLREREGREGKLIFEEIWERAGIKMGLWEKFGMSEGIAEPWQELGSSAGTAMVVLAALYFVIK